MVESDHFFLVFFLTILITRIWLFAFPIPSPTINGFRLHHWMYGIGLLFAAMAVSSEVIFSIGLGLVIDETTFLLSDGKTHEDNYSRLSLAGTMILVVLIYVFREVIFKEWPWTP